MAVIHGVPGCSLNLSYEIHAYEFRQTRAAQPSDSATNSR